LFKEVCRLLDIDKDRTTPYHPQSDGFVERMNRTIEAMISMFVSPGQRDWDEYLPYIMMAYRSAVQDTTGYSPNLMMLGREVELPIDLVLGTPPGEESSSTRIEYVKDMNEKMEMAHQVAREKIKMRSDKQKKYYDLKVHGHRYDRGQFVWLHNPARKIGISPKLVRSWEGPYVVVKRMSDVTYRVQLNPRAKMKVVHFDRLKPYKGSDKKSWLPLESIEVEDMVETDGGPSVDGTVEGTNQDGVDGAIDLDETVLYDVADMLSGESMVDGHEVLIRERDAREELRDPDYRINETLVYQPNELGNDDVALEPGGGDDTGINKMFDREIEYGTGRPLGAPREAFLP
jgi:hypothetical protein